MDHHRPVRVVVGADVFQAEPLRQDVIELDRAELPLTAQAVADECVRSLNGRIQVESTEGQGTRFVVTLPQQLPPPPV